MVKPLTYLPEIKMLHKALILFHATWSGYSLVNRNRILLELQDIDANKMSLFIVDIDTMDFTQMQSILLGNLAHGYAESVWIENGKVVKLCLQASDIVDFVAFIKASLADIDE